MRKAAKPMVVSMLHSNEVAARVNQRSAIKASPYRWPDPTSLPPRKWLFGQWLLEGEVTVVIAPGGTGKSTISIAIALSLASGKSLLGKDLPRGPQSTWIFNLEDGLEELERQVAAASAHHDIAPEDCADRLHLDSGLKQPLCTATENQDGFVLAEDVFAELKATIIDRKIAVMIVDPFVSSHALRENGNEAVDALIKRWKLLAQETGCAIILVHHTKKLGGREVTAEDGRGAVSLRDAARIVLTLNSMSKSEGEALGITDPAIRRSLVRVDTGKANRAAPEVATWVKLESHCLDNGNPSEPDDHVGVAVLWEKTKTFHGLSLQDLYLVQQEVATGKWKQSVLAADWVGLVVAKVAGLSVVDDKRRIQAILKTWFE